MKDPVKEHDLSSAIEEVINHKSGDAKLQPMAFDNAVNVKELREKCAMTQEEFSRNFGVSLATLQGWEQGRRKPEGPANILLNLIKSRPELVKEVLASYLKNRDRVY